MDRTHRTTGKMGTGQWTLALLAVLAITISSCRLTDHTENEPRTVTTKDLQIPESGYDGQGTARLPEITFDSTALDMGRIVEGVQVEKVFSFVNTGQVDLVITDVRGSCGCTVAKNWPRMPIAPGERKDITVNFDSEGRPGMQHKTISVVANTTPPTTVLRLTGEVVSPNQ